MVGTVDFVGELFRRLFQSGLEALVVEDPANQLFTGDAAFNMGA